MSKKDPFCAYFTNSQAILNVMVSLLRAENGDLILEPSAGQGVFVEEILERTPSVDLTLIEMNRTSAQQLKDKFSKYPNCRVLAKDFLAMSNRTFPQGFNKVIGNPPYGAWQTQTRRKELKDAFRREYVKETYSLFLSRSIDLLQEGGRLVFIVPDTFLYLHRHRGLREKIRTQTLLEDLFLFPSHFFPGVDFGYSGLSIVSLVKRRASQTLSNGFDTSGLEPEKLCRVHQGFSSAEALIAEAPFIEKTQDEILCREAWLEGEVRRAFRGAAVFLGQIADVVTGIYSGNNARFVTSENPNRSEWIPLLKAARSQPYAYGEDRYWIRWDEEALRFYRSDKKARYQNADYYFRVGIGMPMVKSKRIRAFYMEGKVFDQSVVGIFPKDPSLIDYLLAFLNSRSADEWMRKINPTANNSCNYVKRLPILRPSAAAEEQRIGDLARRLRADKTISASERTASQAEIDRFFEALYR